MGGVTVRRQAIATNATHSIGRARARCQSPASQSSNATPRVKFMKPIIKVPPSKSGKTNRDTGPPEGPTAVAQKRSPQARHTTTRTTKIFSARSKGNTWESASNEK